MNDPKHRLLAAVAAIVMMAAGQAAAAEGLTLVGRPEGYDSPEQIQREEAVMDAAGFSNWPQSQRLTTAPAVDKSLLSRPELVTRESRSYEIYVLDGTECAELSVRWGRLEPRDAADVEDVPDGVPAAKAERYMVSKANAVVGQLDVKVLVAPSSRAAQEYLLFESTISSAPTEAVASQFVYAKPISDIGDVAFKVSSRKESDGIVRFVRDNVAVIIRGEGVFGEEIEQLARKLDAAIVQRPELASLEAARPSIALGELRRRKSADAANQWAYSFDATAPQDASIANLAAEVNGEYATVKNGEVLFGGYKAQYALKITAVTDTLMAAVIEKEVVVDAKLVPSGE